MGVGRSAKLSQPSRLRKQRQQVAAVCYRLRANRIEFLLVQTRGGRWTFPKGGVEPRLTYAQSAAREALEEAGVHGRIEEVSFARYYRQRPELAAFSQSPSSSSESKLKSQPDAELAVAAYLCEVSHLEPPQESNRNPRWFSVEKVKQRLRKDRTPEFGEELSRVVDRATSRIERVNGVPHILERERSLEVAHTDGLRKVRFEADEAPRLHGDQLKAMVIGYSLRRSNLRSLSSCDELLPTPRESAQRLAARTNAATGKVRNVTAIDSTRTSKLTHSSSVS